MRGKYTLPIRLLLATMLSAAPVSAEENRYHGSMPANTISA